MATIRLGPNDLLEYDALYGILTCRSCQYAIQKSAIERHLLGHKIYREERRRLLLSIAQFVLLEPENVPLPVAKSVSNDNLPVLDSYRCMKQECGNLYASKYGMKRHRGEHH